MPTPQSDLQPEITVACNIDGKPFLFQYLLDQVCQAFIVFYQQYADLELLSSVPPQCPCYDLDLNLSLIDKHWKMIGILRVVFNQISSSA